MVLFIHDVKKIKGAADRNGLKNATCKQSLNVLSQEWFAISADLEQQVFRKRWRWG